MKSRSLLASFATLIALAAAPAVAADMRMPVKAPPAPAPVAVYNWTGFYIGAHVGGAWTKKDWTDVDAGFTNPSLGSHDASGFIAGGQIGFNWQAPGSNWVIGVEAQGSWADLKGEHISLGDLQFETKVKWLATVAGRLGYAVDRVLLYVKGGVAFAGDEHAFFDLDGGVLDPTFNFTADKTRTGWMAGGGLEWAFAGNWSAKVEYNYLDFGAKDVTFSGVPPTIDGPFTLRIDQHVHVAKFGINYRFGGPVVARY